MITINVHLTSDEWDRVRLVAAQWPQEELSRTELGRMLLFTSTDALSLEEPERVFNNI